MQVTPLRFTYDDLKTASENFSRKLGIALSMKEPSMLMGPKWPSNACMTFLKAKKSF